MPVHPAGVAKICPSGVSNCCKLFRCLAFNDLEVLSISVFNVIALAPVAVSEFEPTLKQKRYRLIVRQLAQPPKYSVHELLGRFVLDAKTISTDFQKPQTPAVIAPQPFNLSREQLFGMPEGDPPPRVAGITITIRLNSSQKSKNTRQKKGTTNGAAFSAPAYSGCIFNVHPGTSGEGPR